MVALLQIQKSAQAQEPCDQKKPKAFAKEQQAQQGGCGNQGADSQGPVANGQHGFDFLEHGHTFPVGRLIL
jgi:hypothetical protein